MTGCRQRSAVCPVIGRWLWLVALLALSGCTLMPVDLPGSDTRAARANTELGLAYLEEGRPAAARDVLLKAVELDSRLAGAQAALAVAHSQLGESREARERFLAAIGLEPEDASIRNNYGVHLCADGDYAEAQRQFTLALAAPDYRTPERVLSNAGACAISEGDTARARIFLEQALVHEPLHAPALLRLSRLAYQEGALDLAWGWLRRLERSQELDAAGLDLAVAISERLGDTEAAAAYREARMRLGERGGDSSDALLRLGE